MLRDRHPGMVLPSALTLLGDAPVVGFVWPFKSQQGADHVKFSARFEQLGDIGSTAPQSPAETQPGLFMELDKFLYRNVSFGTCPQPTHPEITRAFYRLL